MGTIAITEITQLAPPFIIGFPGLSDYATFYRILAEGMDNMMISVNINSDAIVKVMELLVYMINLTMDQYFDVNQALLDINTVMIDVYRNLIILPRDNAQIYPGVIATNEHTKRYITDDLTDFVNNEVWPLTCVPYEWAIASEITGEDISGWNVCDPS